jgi:uncharacterized protein YecE (DUF72 family)
MKAWQLITHEPKSPTYRRLKAKIPEAHQGRYGYFKPTEEVLAAWETTKKIADALESNVIVFQCPASFAPDSENMKNMKRFFSRIKRGTHILAWEPRGTWLPSAVASFCRDLDLVHVVDPFVASQAYGNIGYYRLHGRSGYRYKYTADDLYSLEELARKKKDCYVMFNNVHMYEDAAAFYELIRYEYDSMG